MTRAVEVRPFEDRDERGVLELLRLAFGEWPHDLDSTSAGEFFRWKHMAGPLGPSMLMVAEADDVIVGCHAYMPWRLSAGGRVLCTMRGMDLAVHPSYRRRGISTALRSAARFDGDVAFMWSHPNDQNRPGALRAGMCVVEELPRFVRPCGRLTRALRRAGAGGSRGRRSLPVQAETAAELLSDGARASQLIAGTDVPEGRMATVRDLTYLRWRYGHLAEYRAFAADVGAAQGGVAIFRVRRQGPLWVADVCELFTRGGDRGTVRLLLGLVSRAAPVDVISCRFSSRGEAARFGFIQCRGQTVLMVLPLRREIFPDPTSSVSWALSRGDLELL